jgi:DNA-binding NarL/FixJ family response regulator
MARIKALFLSDEPVVLTTLKNMFKGNTVIQADFNNYSNFDEILYPEKQQYEVIIFDDGCLKRKEIEIIGDFAANVEQIKKILFTGRTDKRYLEHFIRSGMNGLLSKKEETEELGKAIISVTGNKKYYSDVIMDFIMNDEQNNENLNILTGREKEIIEFLQKGFQNKEIAGKLSLSRKTVDNHKQNIKKKLGRVYFNKIIDIIESL